jgi:uncharacterized protein with von Willebrand factor type A (vWA) domain
MAVAQVRRAVAASALGSPGRAGSVEEMARRVDGRMVSPELDDLGAAVVGSYLGDRGGSYGEQFGGWYGGERGFWVG